MVPRSRADFAHEIPVFGQCVTATDALAAVFPGKTVLRLDDAERHLSHLDLRPLDIQFFGHQHWQRSTYALADLGLTTANDHAAIGLYLDKEADLALAERVTSDIGQCDRREP